MSSFNEPPATVRLPHPQVCSCVGSPFCDGPSGTRWLDCDPRCKGCHPPSPRRTRQAEQSRTSNRPRGLAAGSACPGAAHPRRRRRIRSRRRGVTTR